MSLPISLKSVFLPFPAAKEAHSTEMINFLNF